MRFKTQLLKRLQSDCWLKQVPFSCSTCYRGWTVEGGGKGGGRGARGRLREPGKGNPGELTNTFRLPNTHTNTHIRVYAHLYAQHKHTYTHMHARTHTHTHTNAHSMQARVQVRCKLLVGPFLINEPFQQISIFKVDRVITDFCYSYL